MCVVIDFKIFSRVRPWKVLSLVCSWFAQAAFAGIDPSRVGEMGSTVVTRSFNPLYDQIHEQWKRAPSAAGPTNKILPIPDQNSFTYSKRGGFGKLNGLILPYGYQSHFEILSKFDLFSNGPKLDRFKCKKQ